jgi:glycosyltransferase involved in cell wall biosynthesis
VRKIIACYLTFNSANVIEESLASVIDLVDHVVLVDGALLGVETLFVNSSDGTIEVAKRIVGRKGVVVKVPRRLTEPQLRNMLVQIVRDRFPRSWLFSIDADEVLHDAEREFEYLRTKEADIYRIAHIRRNDVEYIRMYGFELYAGIRDRTPFHPRFYSGIPGLHYAENHWTLRDNMGERVERKYPSIHLKEAWLDHRRNRRDPRYLDNFSYYNTYERWKYEKVERPLRSYLPRRLIGSSKRILRKGGLNGEFLLNWVYAYTLGSWTRNDPELA